ncbi:hypothetical protein BH10BAC2_BH10BAC2_35220 [soil metagenome]
MKIKLPFSFCALLLSIVLQQPLQTQAWKLLGNSGTDPATQFLGTKDNKALVFRINNIERMRIANSGKLGIGLTTPEALLNVAVNDNVNLSSTDNFLLGSTTGYNLAFDNNELQARNNGAPGELRLNYWGGSVWIGKQGSTASPAIYVGSGRVGIGGSAVSIENILTVNPSSGLGGILITDAVNNTAFSASKTGTGYVVNVSKTNALSSTATVYATNAGAGEGVYAYSKYGNGIYGSTGSTQNAGDYAGYFNGAVYASGTYFSSDEKLKQNIADFPRAMDIITRLLPKQYQFRQDGNYKLMNLPQGNHYGLIAQDVEKVLPNLVKNSKFQTSLSKHSPSEEEAKNSETIEFKAINYIELIPIVIKGMQELSKMNNEKDAKIEALEERLAKVETMLNGQQSSTIKDKQHIIKFINVSLEQNIPNPFTNTTTINYTLPQQYSSAKIIITDISGKTLKEVNVSGSGKGSLKVDAYTLSSGAYQYSLYVDGRLIGTKQMILAK